MPPEPEPEPEPEPAPRVAGGHPQGSSGSPGSRLGYLTCLDRPFVQKEIRWARQHNKKIITLYESERDRPSYFDYSKATDKYEGTEWEDILGIDAIKYQREQFLAEAMMQNVLAKMSTEAVAAAGIPINMPGWWEFFLSHHQSLGGDQMKTLSLLFEKKHKSNWYDNGQLDKSVTAMEEGVAHCQNFVLLLTADASTAECKLQLDADINTIPPGSQEEERFKTDFVDALAKLLLDRWNTHNGKVALDNWLTECDCGQFNEQLQAVGVDSLVVLCDLDSEEIDELAAAIGMARFKAKSFQKQCMALQEQVRLLSERITVARLRSGSIIVEFEIRPAPEQDASDAADVHEIKDMFAGAPVETIVQHVQQIVDSDTTAAATAPSAKARTSSNTVAKLIEAAPKLTVQYTSTTTERRQESRGAGSLVAVEAEDAHGNVDEASRRLGADRPGAPARSSGRKRTPEPEPKADPFGGGLTTVDKDKFFGEQQYLRRASELSHRSSRGDSLFSNATTANSEAASVVDSLRDIVTDREAKAGLGSTLSRTVTGTATGDPLDVVRKEKQAASAAMRADFASSISPRASSRRSPSRAAAYSQLSASGQLARSVDMSPTAPSGGSSSASERTVEQRTQGDDTEWHECEHDCGFTRKGRKGYAEVEAHEADCNNSPRTPTLARSTRSGTLTLLPVHADEELSPAPGPARNRQDRSQTDRSPSPTRYGRSLSAVERREWERTDNFRYTISAVIPEQQQPLALGLGFKEDNGKPVVTEIHHGAAKHLFRGLCVGAILDKITLPGGEEGPTGHGGLPYANAMQLLMDTVKEGTPIHLTFEHPWQRIKRNGLDIYINHETGVEQRSRPVELDAVVDRMHHDAKFPEAEFFPRKAPADQVALRLATAKGWADSWDAHRGHQQEDEHRMAEAEVEDSRQAQKKRDSGGRSRMVTGTAPGDPLEVIRKEKRAAAPAMRADFASRQAVDSSVEVLMDYLDSALHGSDEEQALALRPERPRMQVTVRVQEWDIVTIDGQDVAQWVLLVAPPVPAGSTKLVGCIRVRLSHPVRRVC